MVGPTNSGFGSALEKGDFDGDGVEDVVVGAIGQGALYLVLGKAGYSPGVMDVTAGDPFPKIVKSGLGNYVAVGDFGGDGKDDLALSDPEADVPGRTNSGEIHIINGRNRSDFPAQWTLGAPNADVRLMGKFNYSLGAVAAGDMTGDGRAELVLQSGVRINNEESVYAVDGQDVSSDRPLLDALEGNADSVTLHRLLEDNSVPVGNVVSTDFDGDGAKEVLGRFFSPLRGALTSRDRPGSVVLSNLNRRDLQWDLPDNISARSGAIVTGDWNGDGYGDVALYEGFGGQYSPYGALRLLFGYRPLRNPTVRIKERTPTSPRVSLDLAVEGTPTEIFLSGDLGGPFLDRWLPFKSPLPVDLSSMEGSKTVRVVFRNAVGRQSEQTLDTVSLTVNQTGTEPFSNVLYPGGQVRFYCRLTDPARVKAELWTRFDEPIRVLLDDDREPGVWPVVWDGRNSSGELVAPGMYLLTITVNGHGERYKIVVRG